MRKQVEAWQRSELTDVTAKVVIYEAFIEGTLEAPKHLVGGGLAGMVAALRLLERGCRVSIYDALTTRRQGRGKQGWGRLQRTRISHLSEVVLEHLENR